MSIVGRTEKPVGGGGTVPPSAATWSSQAACSGLTSFGAVGPAGTPKIQEMPTRISVMPITRMIVPVTTGGKNRSIRLAIGAISTPMTPAAMIEPKIIRAPSAPGWVSAIDTIGPTEAKVTPIITGSRTPNQGVRPSDCRMDTTPQQKRSAEIRKATSSGASCSARPMISGTAMAPAYMTSTCCKPSVKSLGAGSISSTGCVAVAMRTSGLGEGATVSLRDRPRRPGPGSMEPDGAAPGASCPARIRRPTDQAPSRSGLK